MTNIKQLCEYTINLFTELKDIQLANLEIEKQVQELNEFVTELSDEISLDSSDYDSHDEQVYISHSLQQLSSTQRRATKVSKNADTLFLDDQKPAWHRLVARISHYFSRLFRCCVNYSDITLNEIVYFNDTNSVVKRCLEAEPQQLLNLALKTPSSYLNCNECATISPHSIDISILYNLYLECSRMINLRDLYEAFKSVLNTSVDDPTIQ